MAIQEKFPSSRDSGDGQAISAGEKWKELLGKPTDLKVIRDPVHKDILLTPLEVAIVDTREFQRLRHHRQLGPSYLIYPGAEHSRFQHALGTLEVARKMIESINNPLPIGSENTVQVREVVLTRLCALLHDIVNIPFGHTIEDEGNLVTRDWKDDRRIPEILGADRNVGRLIVSRIDAVVGPGEGLRFLDELVKTLVATDDEQVEALPHPFVSDIVSNTVCADLLDYLGRDTYFTGIQKSYDWRIVRYFVLATYNKHKRLAIRLWTSKRRMKRDILSELVSLLHMRYSLAEMVYYHHAKMAASAMLIRAVHDSGILEDKKSFQKLLEYGDDELLSLLRSGAKESTKEILQSYGERRLYKPVYQISYAKRSAGAVGADSISKAGEKFYDPKKSRDLESKLEALASLQALGAKKGHIVVYCPNPKMNMKVATTKVVWQDDSVYELTSVPDQDLQSEVKSIEEKHRKLWKLMVFVHPVTYQKAVEKGIRDYLAEKCQEAIGVMNELPYHMSELERRVVEGEDVTLRLQAFTQVHDYSTRNVIEAVSDDETVELVRLIAQRGERDGRYVSITDSQIQELLVAVRKAKSR